AGVEPDPGGVPRPGLRLQDGCRSSGDHDERPVPDGERVLLPGFCDPCGSVVRRSLQLGLFAVVLLGLIGGSLAFFVAQKSVKLTVDGQLRTVGTYASTVGDVLVEEGLEPAAHDVVLPAPDQQIADGDTVLISRARPLELTVD